MNVLGVFFLLLLTFGSSKPEKTSDIYHNRKRQVQKTKISLGRNLRAKSKSHQSSKSRKLLSSSSKSTKSSKSDSSSSSSYSTSSTSKTSDSRSSVSKSQDSDTFPDKHVQTNHLTMIGDISSWEDAFDMVLSMSTKSPSLKLTTSTPTFHSGPEVSKHSAPSLSPTNFSQSFIPSQPSLPIDFVTSSVKNNDTSPMPTLSKSSPPDIVSSSNPSQEINGFRKPSTMPSLQTSATLSESSTEKPSVALSLKPSMMSSKSEISIIPSVGPSQLPSLQTPMILIESPTDIPSTVPSSNPSMRPSREETSMVPSLKLPQENSTAPSLLFISTFSWNVSVPTSTFSQRHTNPCNSSIEERERRIMDILVTVSDPLDLVEPNTPQNLAAKWLIYDDMDYFICPGDDSLVQRYVMSVLYFATGGDAWIKCSRQKYLNNSICEKQSFLSSVSECLWGGLTCHHHSGKLKNVTFEGNNLIGTIPVELSSLNELQILSLERGSLSSTIPSSLSDLENLLILDLDFNALSGTIPSNLYTLSTLLQLDLNDNQLSGTIGDGIHGLQNLVFLQLQNNFLSGTFPALDSLDRLRLVEVYGNNFTGQISGTICDEIFPKGNILVLTSDCSGESPKVECSCCTNCYF